MNSQWSRNLAAAGLWPAFVFLLVMDWLGGGGAFVLQKRYVVAPELVRDRPGYHRDAADPRRDQSRDRTAHN